MKDKKAQALFSQISSELSQQSQKINKIENQNQELKNTIEEFIKNSSFKISSIGQHTLRRKLYFK